VVDQVAGQKHRRSHKGADHAVAVRDLVALLDEDEA
jgi:hypothetical protein